MAWMAHKLRPRRRPTWEPWDPAMTWHFNQCLARIMRAICSRLVSSKGLYLAMIQPFALPRAKVNPYYQSPIRCTPGGGQALPLTSASSSYSLTSSSSRCTRGSLSTSYRRSVMEAMLTSRWDTCACAVGEGGRCCMKNGEGATHVGYGRA